MIDPDTDLVARAGQGDRAAAQALMARHLPKMLTVARRMLGSQAESEDAVQDAFLKVWTHASRWQPGKALFETWLYRVVILKDEPLVWLSRDNLQRYNNKLLSGCVQSGLSPLIIQEVSTLSIQLSLISAGMGLGLIGSEVESRMPRNLFLRKVRGLDVSFSLILIWRRDNEAPALANLVREFSR